MRADQVLPDHLNEGEFNGVIVRKGTVGAFIANHRVLVDPLATPEAKALALKDLTEALPALQALGLFEVMEIRNPDLRVLVEQALQAR